MPEIRLNHAKLDPLLVAMLEHQKVHGTRVDIEKFLDADGAWQCIQCGACCRMVGMIEGPLVGPGFDYDRGDGACVHLTESSLCSIYEDRPHACRVPKIRDEIGMATACARLYEIQQVRAGMLPPPWEVNDDRSRAAQSERQHIPEADGAAGPDRGGPSQTRNAATAVRHREG